jgi:hypothetical protein
MLHNIVVRTTTGDIVGGSKSVIVKSNDPTLQVITVPDEYQPLFDEISRGVKNIHNYKVNIDGNSIRIYSIEETLDNDPDFNQFIQLPFSPARNNQTTDLVVTVFTRDHSPRMIVKYNGPPSAKADPSKNSFDLHLTGKGDINAHYQTFNCNFDEFDENNEKEFMITDMNPTKLFANDFSLYYRKIFISACYTIK